MSLSDEALEIIKKTGCDPGVKDAKSMAMELISLRDENRRQRELVDLRVYQQEIIRLESELRSLRAAAAKDAQRLAFTEGLNQSLTEKNFELQRRIESLEFRIISAVGPYVSRLSADCETADDLLIHAVKEFDRLYAELAAARAAQQPLTEKYDGT